jgi:hypothetical protein
MKVNPSRMLQSNDVSMYAPQNASGCIEYEFISKGVVERPKDGTPKLYLEPLRGDLGIGILILTFAWLSYFKLMQSNVFNIITLLSNVSDMIIFNSKTQLYTHNLPNMLPVIYGLI